VSSSYIPDRADLVWLDFEPTKGREIGKYRPALVLSGKAYNRQSGLLICCPVSTRIRGALTEVPLEGLGKPSVVAANLVQTLSWRERKVKHIAHVNGETYRAALHRLLPLLGAAEIL
jgi:mRNA interferase MazF